MIKIHIAAIHDEILSRYITGVSGTQKSAYAFYFFRPAEAVRRYPFQELLHKDVIGQIGILCALTEEILIILSCVYAAWWNRVDSDPIGSKLISDSAADATARSTDGISKSKVKVHNPQARGRLHRARP